MIKYTVGLLPLYIELYDAVTPQMRGRVEGFRQTIIDGLERNGCSVTAAPVCCVRMDFEQAIARFELECVDAIVTLHLAYSPSLESSKVLAATKLPIVVLDTTPGFCFDSSTQIDEINYNHGIHGVQDMCSLLGRNGKEFFIEAGHWEKSDVLARVAGCVRAIKLATQMRKARVGRIGQSFEGMGDFLTPEDVMRSSIGIETIPYDFGGSNKLLETISDCEIDAEMAQDSLKFDLAGLNPETHRRATIASLMLRKWIEQQALTAFTVNFMAIDRQSGIPCMPFLEACKAMSRGLGYAGEGDVLTAALVGALASVYQNVSFTEMFCPDWEHDTILLSHMGEMNLDLCAEKPRLAEEEYPYTDAQNPAVLYGRFRAGEGVIVNLVPGANDAFSLIIAPVRMLDITGEDHLKNTVHGWMKPALPISEFLARYSMEGGTHHSALVYGNIAAEIEKFGRLMGWRVVSIG